jgi:hypothetical protein
MTNTSLDTLKKAQALLNKAVEEEQRWGEGEANFIVFENAERMVAEYETAIEQGTINNEPIIVKE